MKPPTRRSHGFTLIELLVVISIIALLIGILLPALGSARFQARNIRCATQEQQLGRAMAVYSNDFDGFIVVVADRDRGPHVPFDDLLAEGGYDGRDARSQFTTPTGFFAINFVEAMESPLYNCPLDTVTHELFGTERVPRSYAMSGRAPSPPAGGPSGSGLMPGPSGFTFSLRYDDVTQGSNTIVLVDSNDLDPANPSIARNSMGAFNFSQTVPFAYDPAGGPAVPARVVSHHRTNSDGVTGVATTGYTPNFLFADSHVENLSNEDTFEGQDGAFDYRGSMWDARQ